MPGRAPLTYLAPIEWNAITQRPQHIARLLSRKYDVTYLEPVGLRSMRWGDLSRIALRLGRLPAPGASGVSSSLAVINLFYVPLLQSRWITRLNTALLRGGIRRKIPAADSEELILWITSPSLLARIMLENTSPKLVVYDCMDEYGAMHRKPYQTQINETEERILQRADVVFASSILLADRLRRKNSNCVHVGNGVDISVFYPAAAQSLPVPRDMDSLRHPIIGYYGMLGEWLDYELLSSVARAKPDWQIVLIGPKNVQLNKVLAAPNVVWLGPKPYGALPQYAKFFDVAIIPFLVNEVTLAVNPVKLFEYLALGKPVVSTALPEVTQFRDVVSIANNKEEFVSAIESEIRTTSFADKVQQRFEVAKMHCWEAKVKEMEDRLDTAEACHHG